MDEVEEVEKDWKGAAPALSPEDVPLCDCHGVPKVRVNKGQKHYAWVCRVKQGQRQGRTVYPERVGTAPEDQPYTLAGSNLDMGSNRKKQEFIRPPKPTKSLPAQVAEIAPLFHTYGQFTYDIDADELVPPRGAPIGCYFDPQAAQYAVDRMQSLVQYEGLWAGHHVEFLLWELRLVRYVFGWKRPGGLRLIRTLYVEVPRKSGKTVLAALIAIFMQFWDDEASPQVFFAAVDQSQASIGWNAARMFIQSNEALNDASLVYSGDQKSIKTPFNNGELKALTGKSPNKFGLNLHCLVFDELMAQALRDMWDALTTAQGAREQPLIVAITTSGFNRNSVAFEQHEYTRQIGNESLEDPTFLGVCYGLPLEEDWTLLENWKKAAPSLGYIVPFDYYAAECAAAKGQPSRQTAFRTLNLCQWVGQEKRAIDMREWEQNERPIDLESLLDKPCFAGLDLSTTVSLTGFALAFPDEPEPGLYTVLVHHFLPDYDLQDKSYKARVDYPLWADAGWLTLIPGPAIQDEYVIEYIKEQMAKYSIIDCTFDRYGMVKIHHHLTDVGLPMIASGQDIKSMSYVCKEFERLIALHQLVADDPMIKWQIDNLSWATDVAGNIKPDRLNSGSRIDGVVAMLMALDGAFRRGSRASASVYDSYGPDSFFDMAEAELRLAMKLKEEAEAEG